MGSGENSARRGHPLASGVGIIVTLTGAYAVWRWVEAMGGGPALFERFGALAVFVSVPVHILLSASPFPSEVIAVANGNVYGLWLGTACSWLGWWGGAILEYGLVRLGVRSVAMDDVRDDRPTWLRRFPATHPVFLIVGRQLPFGFHTVNVLAGLAGVSLRRQILCAALANLPYAFVCAAAGSGWIAARSV